VFAATCAWQLRDAAAARLKVGVAGDASYPLVPQAFRPFWFGWGAWLLATVASFLAFGLSTVAVYWADKVAGGEGLPFVFSVSAVVWGVVGILVVVALVPVAAVVLQRPAGGASSSSSPPPGSTGTARRSRSATSPISSDRSCSCSRCA